MQLTHHDAAVEAPCSDRNDDVLPVTFQNLATGNHETVRVGMFMALFLLDAFLVADLPNSIGFTSRTTLVALDVMSAQEDSIARNDFTRLK